MLLTISTTAPPATDLGFLLHKHPANKPAVTALREIGRGKVALKEDIDETVRLFVADRKRIDGENRTANQRMRHGGT